MKVYVLEIGAYDEHGIEGVYESPEAAMAAHSPKPPKDFKKWYANQKPPAWEWKRHKQFGEWGFDADNSNVASITEYEVRGVSNQESGNV